MGNEDIHINKSLVILEVGYTIRGVWSERAIKENIENRLKIPFGDFLDVKVIRVNDKKV